MGKYGMLWIEATLRVLPQPVESIFACYVEFMVSVVVASNFRVDASIVQEKEPIELPRRALRTTLAMPPAGTRIQDGPWTVVPPLGMRDK